MRKKYYHAATPETMEKIIADGVVKRGWDGCVYLCEKPQDAAKFLAVHERARPDTSGNETGRKEDQRRCGEYHETVRNEGGAD